MYTEEEAKGKACPNMFDLTPSYYGRKCIASECMAWRWSDTQAVECTKDEVRMLVRTGYCGLVGEE